MQRYRKNIRTFFSFLFLSGLFALVLSGNLQAQTDNTLNTLSGTTSARNPDQPETQQKKNDWKEDPPKGTPGLHKGRFFTGGGIGAQFGQLTAVEIAPMVGYIPHRLFRFGLTFNFSYIKDNYYTPPVSDYFWGGSLFARLYPIQYLFLHVEIGGFNQSYGMDRQRKWMAYPLAGIGGSYTFGRRMGISLTVLYNFNHSEYSIYGNPIVRIGFDVGL